NLADLFESLVDAIPERLALVSGERRLTFAQLDERANRLAHTLAARNVRAGDHVGLFLYNGTEFVEAMLAAFKLRAVPVNINYRYVEDELAFLLANADIAALLYQPELSSRVAAVADRTPDLRVRLAVGDEYESALNNASSARPVVERSGEDLYIIYTGG